MVEDEIKESCERIKALATVYDQCNPEFLDALIYEQLAEESRYNALLIEARKGNR